MFVEFLFGSGRICTGYSAEGHIHSSRKQTKPLFFFLSSFNFSNEKRFKSEMTEESSFSSSRWATYRKSFPFLRTQQGRKKWNGSTIVPLFQNHFNDWQLNQRQKSETNVFDDCNKCKMDSHFQYLEYGMDALGTTSSLYKRTRLYRDERLPKESRFREIEQSSPDEIIK